jgi:hypothetical protein
MVVRHRAWQQDLDLAAQRGFDETVREGVVGFAVGAQQELPLGAPARDHVELTWEDLAGQHARRYNQESCQFDSTSFRDVSASGVRLPATSAGHVRYPDTKSVEQRQSRQTLDALALCWPF